MKKHRFTLERGVFEEILANSYFHKHSRRRKPQQTNKIQINLKKKIHELVSSILSFFAFLACDFHSFSIFVGGYTGTMDLRWSIKIFSRV
jgi:hypothetical protein